jgi:predicted glycosyltransferase
MVLVPFETATETEQAIRARRLRDRGLAEVVWESELTPSTLARAIDQAADRPAAALRPLDLDGAAASARLIAALAAQAAPPEPGR